MDKCMVHFCFLFFDVTTCSVWHLPQCSGYWTTHCQTWWWQYHVVGVCFSSAGSGKLVTMFDSENGMFKVICSVSFPLYIVFLHFSQKVQFQCHLTTAPSSLFALSPTWLLANCKQDFLWLSFNNSFLLATLPYRPGLCSARLKVVLWTDSPTSAVDLCSSSDGKRLHS